ncbi:hypothetical protein B0J13DRAFT_643732 [Dactylonectria estremocensis]|uniref:Uncharacterized protein n=1 Tax=Dactylonectria estremocensis TaxID=1079267 RepID=A0A9P9JG21_9HYPO|nr:hypothetical protein B0J13DRAFT_643732 [Dactylonectria estremocensis]
MRVTAEAIANHQPPHRGGVEGGLLGSFLLYGQLSYARMHLGFCCVATSHRSAFAPSAWPFSPGRFKGRVALWARLGFCSFDGPALWLLVRICSIASHSPAFCPPLLRLLKTPSPRACLAVSFTPSQSSNASDPVLPNAIVYDRRLCQFPATTVTPNNTTYYYPSRHCSLPTTDRLRQSPPSLASRNVPVPSVRMLAAIARQKRQSPDSRIAFCDIAGFTQFDRPSDTPSPIPTLRGSRLSTQSPATIHQPSSPSVFTGHLIVCWPDVFNPTLSIISTTTFVH